MPKKLRIILSFVSSLFFSISLQALENSSPKLVVIIPSYNNIDFFEKNLSSVFEQDYSNFRVIYIDDASEDGTGHAVQKWIEEKNKAQLFTLVINSENKGGLYNIYHSVHSCEKDEIICLLDGDDWLKSPQALSIIANYYENKDVWLTYGQFEHYPSGKVGLCKQIDEDDLKNQRIRSLPWVTSHMKTFYAGLFQKIKIEDLQTLGAFVPSATDLTLMFPMIDMATTHVKYIPEVIYVYNNRNPLSHHQVRHPMQKIYAQIARARTTYPPLDKPPFQEQ
jgi:glycosyltransferase involved in cell wall biosynthesis